MSELCQNPSDWGLWRSVLSERQTPQVIVFSRKRSEKGERIDRAFVRPRQVRYQAALRPDMNSRTDSKAPPNPSPPQTIVFIDKYALTVHVCDYSTRTGHFDRKFRKQVCPFLGIHWRGVEFARAPRFILFFRHRFSSCFALHRLWGQLTNVTPEFPDCGRHDQWQTRASRNGRRMAKTRS